MKCAIFDIDNTLFDSRRRFYLVLRKYGVTSPSEVPLSLRKRFWLDYMDPSLFHLDRPIPRAVEMVLEAKLRGLKVVLITGRYELVRVPTEIQLRSAGIPFDELLMRPNDNMDKDYVLKPNLVKKIDCKFSEYHDDDLDTLLVLRKIYPQAVYFHHQPDGTFTILGGLDDKEG